MFLSPLYLSINLFKKLATSLCLLIRRFLIQGQFCSICRVDSMQTILCLEQLRQLMLAPIRPLLIASLDGRRFSLSFKALMYLYPFKELGMLALIHEEEVLELNVSQPFPWTCCLSCALSKAWKPFFIKFLLFTSQKVSRRDRKPLSLKLLWAFMAISERMGSVLVICFEL